MNTSDPLQAILARSLEVISDLVKENEELRARHISTQQQVAELKSTSKRSATIKKKKKN